MVALAASAGRPLIVTSPSLSMYSAISRENTAADACWGRGSHSLAAGLRIHGILISHFNINHGHRPDLTGDKVGHDLL